MHSDMCSINLREYQDLFPQICMFDWARACGPLITLQFYGLPFAAIHDIFGVAHYGHGSQHRHFIHCSQYRPELCSPYWLPVPCWHQFPHIHFRSGGKIHPEPPNLRSVHPRSIRGPTCPYQVPCPPAVMTPTTTTFVPPFRLFTVLYGGISLAVVWGRKAVSGKLQCRATCLPTRKLAKQ